MEKQISIAIDGPAGAGKTTVAREVARRLGYKYIDTGAMYRAVAWKALQLGVAVSDKTQVTEIAGNINIDFPAGDGSRIFVDGVEISEAIRSPEVTKLSSPVSAISGVRRYLVAHQRRLAGQGGVVMEGRDIGSVVLPYAEVKVFLTASVDERAQRRWKEMRESGQEVDLNELKRDIQERDYRDSNRSDSPLVRAVDAVLIDTDRLSIEEVVSCIINLCKRATA